MSNYLKQYQENLAFLQTAVQGQEIPRNGVIIWIQANEQGQLYVYSKVWEELRSETGEPLVDGGWLDLRSAAWKLCVNDEGVSHFISKDPGMIIKKLRSMAFNVVEWINYTMVFKSRENSQYIWFAEISQWLPLTEAANYLSSRLGDDWGLYYEGDEQVVIYLFSFAPVGVPIKINGKFYMVNEDRSFYPIPVDQFRNFNH